MQRSRQRDDLRELQDADGAATHPAVWRWRSLDLRVLAALHQCTRTLLEYQVELGA